MLLLGLISDVYHTYTSAWMVLKWPLRPLKSMQAVGRIDSHMTGCCFTLIYLLFVIFEAQEGFICVHLEV